MDNRAPKEPLVFIIVLAYNCSQQVRRCLRSLSKLCKDSQRILVVDNGSTDDITEILQTEFSEIPFIQTNTNLGYTGGNNVGIRYAIKHGADYVLVLNPDTIVINPNFLDEMLNYCQANRRVGIAGPRVFLHTAGKVQNTVLFEPGLWRSLVNWFCYRLAPAKFQLSQDVVAEAEVLNGVCVLLRIACLKEIGLFDESIFMYIEDADLDYRARRAGWQVCYLPVESILHEQKTTGYGMTSQVSFLLKRNSVYYLCKIGKRFEAWAYAIISLLLLLPRVCWSGGRSYWLFVRRLALAYREILLRKSLGPAFGPPINHDWLQ